MTAMRANISVGGNTKTRDEVVRRDDDVIDMEATDVTHEPAKPRKARGAAAKILEAREAEEAHDPETGEIADSPDV